MPLISNSVPECDAPITAGDRTVFWLEQTGADVPAGDEWLGVEEIRQQTRLRFAKRRADWRLGRWTAKRAVASCLGRSEHPEQLAWIKVHAAPSGAPQIVLDSEAAGGLAGRSAALTISLSHSSGRALCAVLMSDAALGCDLEEIAPRSEAFVADYFTYDEQAVVANCVPADRSRVATLIWSAKESALKALRTGLRLDTRSLSVSITRSSRVWHPLQVQCPGGQIFKGWCREDEAFVRTVVSGFGDSNRPVRLLTGKQPDHRDREARVT